MTFDEWWTKCEDLENAKPCDYAKAAWRAAVEEVAKKADELDARYCTGEGWDYVRHKFSDAIRSGVNP